jgi:hypothetical protein
MRTSPEEDSVVVVVVVVVVGIITDDIPTPVLPIFSTGWFSLLVLSLDGSEEKCRHC